LNPICVIIEKTIRNIKGRAGPSINKPLKYTNAFTSCERCRVVHNAGEKIQGENAYVRQMSGHFHPLEIDVSGRNDLLSSTLDSTTLM
jgi:hypothetical protein